MHRSIGVGEIHEIGQRDLLEVVNATDRLGFGFGRTQGRQNQAGQDGDNGYHDEQFNEGEAVPESRAIRCHIVELNAVGVKVNEYGEQATVRKPKGMSQK